MFTLLAQCAHVTVPEPSALALSYYNSGNILWILSQIWAFAIPLFLLFTGLSGRISTFAKSKGKKWYFSLVIYLAIFILIYQILDFPLDFYSGYLRQHEYGLSNQDLSRWFNQWGKSFLILLVGAAAFVWIFYLLLKKSPRRWWFYSSLVSIALSFFFVFIQPLWVAPLFHHFGPMKDKVLEAEILGLASRAGIEEARVFEVDMSADTKALNAYVTGFGASKRIVLWDTTLQTLTPDQTLFVTAHEIGHYILHHIWYEVLFLSIFTFAIFYFTYRTSETLLAKNRKRFRFSQLSDIASLPLLLVVLTFYQLVFTPLFNMFSRHLEHEADQFGLEMTHNNRAAGEAFIALQQNNLANPNPGPIYMFWRATHPSLASRVEFCNTYCPWKQEE